MPEPTVERNPDGPPVIFKINRRLFYILLPMLLGVAVSALGGGVGYAATMFSRDRARETQLEVQKAEIDGLRRQLGDITHRLERMENKLDHALERR